MSTLQAPTLARKRRGILSLYTATALAMAILCLYWFFLFSQYHALHATLASGTLPVSAEPKNLAFALDVPYFVASRLLFFGFILITVLQGIWLYLTSGRWRPTRRSVLAYLWWGLFLAALSLFSLFVFRTLQLERASSMALFIQLPRFIWLGSGATLLILLETFLALHLMRRMRDQ